MTSARTSPSISVDSVEAAVDELRARGLRVSSARRLVLETLFAARGPVSAERIADGVAGRVPRSDLASVYRNLETLEQVGLIRHVHLGHGPGLYELARSAQEYLVCESCDAAVAVEPDGAGRRPHVAAGALRLRGAVRPLPDRRPLRPLRGLDIDRREPRGMPDLLALHIPDGFLSSWVAAGAAVPAAAVVLYALRRANLDLDERRVPLLGVTAAFIFAVQMLNFPVAGGTSGHLLGAALAAILLGPWLAALVLTVVLTGQAFVFADGGITALGANVLCMGVIGAFGVGFLMRAARSVLPKSNLIFLGIVGAGSWLAVMAGAAAAAILLGLSGTVPYSTVLPAMLGVHALIGIGEAVITVGAVAAVLATRPDLIAVRDLCPEEIGSRPAGLAEARS